MAKRTKMPTDVNSRARSIVDLATSEEELPDPDEGKNPAAVALGRVEGWEGTRRQADTKTAKRDRPQRRQCSVVTRDVDAAVPS